MTAPFARSLLGWKASTKNKLRWPLVPNFADVDNPESMRIAAGVLDALGVPPDVASDVPKDPGAPLEMSVLTTWPARSPRSSPAGTGSRPAARSSPSSTSTLISVKYTNWYAAIPSFASPSAPITSSSRT